MTDHDFYCSENNLFLIHTGVRFSSVMVNVFLTYVYSSALYYC